LFPYSRQESIERWRYKTETPCSRHKYFLNEDFFETIDTEQKAYWVGFLAADGCISSGRDQKLIILSLSTKDRDHVIKFRDALDATYPIKDRRLTGRHRTTTFSSRIRMTSRKMSLDLTAHGVPPRKTFILKSPIGVPGCLIHHYVRGYFDGDGGIHIRKNGTGSRVSIAGTLELVTFICDTLGFGHVYDHPPKRMSYFKIDKKTEIGRFFDCIYKDATVYLKRKFDIFVKRELVEEGGCLLKVYIG